VATSMTIARPALGALLALALALAFWPRDAAAHTCDDPLSTDLIAGRTIDAGDVKVCNDDTTLTVTYDPTFPWCLLKTDLHVATSRSGIPQNKSGNPIPGQFAYGDEHNCAGAASFEIPLADIDSGVSPGDAVVIAAHAEVEDDTGREEGAWGEGTRFVERGNWAMYFTYVVQAAPPTTSCGCDSNVTPGGTSGASLLAALCPNGRLAPGVIFDDNADLVGPQVPGPGGTDTRSAYLVLDATTFPVCVLCDVGGCFGFQFPPDQAEACLAHLRVSCGQPLP
jgi:hypothetical protein